MLSNIRRQLCSIMAARKLFLLIPNSLEEAKKSGNSKNKKQHSTQVANLVEKAEWVA